MIPLLIVWVEIVLFLDLGALWAVVACIFMDRFEENRR